MLKLLQKFKEECKDLKLKNKQLSLTIKKSQLENAYLETNVEALNEKISNLEEENKNVIDHSKFIEENFNEYALKSLNSINSFEMEQQKVSQPQMKESDMGKDIEIKNLKEQNIVLANELLEVQEQNKKLMESSTRTNRLQQEVLVYSKQIEDLKIQVNIVQISVILNHTKLNSSV